MINNVPVLLSPALNVLSAPPKTTAATRPMNTGGRMSLTRRGKAVAVFSRLGYRCTAISPGTFSNSGANSFPTQARAMPFLAFFQVFGGQRFLHDILFHTPVIDINEQHTGKDRSERQHIARPADRIQVLPVRQGKGFNAAPDVAAAQVTESVIHDHRPSYQHANALHHVRDCYSTKPAEHVVQQAYRAYHEHDNADGGKIADAQPLIDVEDAVDRYRAAI